MADHSNLQRNTGLNHNEMHNTGVHIETENSGVQEKINASHNDHNNPQNDHTIKIENTTDATEEDKNDKLEEASMRS